MTTRKSTNQKASDSPAVLQTEVIIVGGGLAGMTFAALLGTAGVGCVCIDKQDTPTMTHRRYDGRTTAISQASRRVLEAAGIGFVDLIEGRANPDLVEVHRHLPEWDSMLWLVTHVDLHRTPKVQALLSYLKKAVKTGL